MVRVGQESPISSAQGSTRQVWTVARINWPEMVRVGQESMSSAAPRSLIRAGKARRVEGRPGVGQRSAAAGEGVRSRAARAAMAAATTTKATRQRVAWLMTPNRLKNLVVHT